VIVPVLSAALLLGCGSENGPGSIGDITTYVTGDAAKNLDANGQFMLDAPPVGPTPEITEEQALALAKIYARDFAPMLRPSLEKDHGGAINFTQLQPCGRALYAQSAYEPQPTLSRSFQRFIGPWWLVALCEGTASRPSVSLAISALATNLAIQNDKIVWTDDTGGNEFFADGTPSSWDGPIMASPERATAAVAQATGRQIAKVPELIASSPLRGVPQAAMWRLTLNSPATVRGRSSGAVSQVAGLYHGVIAYRFEAGPDANTAAVATATLNQPAADSFPAPQGSATSKIAVPLRPGLAVRFEQASAVPGGQ
jgi:hypothetical protein